MKMRDGREITLTFEVDVEGDFNRGWQVDKITASVAGKEIGYLKLSNIPSQRFADRCPTILNFLTIFSGWCGFPTICDYINTEEGRDMYDRGKSRHPKNLSDDELRETLSSAHNYLRSEYGYAQEFKNVTDRAELLQHLDATIELAEKFHGKAMRKFKAYHVNRPVDDYVSVIPEFRRQGIATHLYIIASKWVESQELNLYLSTCRTPDGLAVSEKLRDLGHIKKKGSREIIIPL